VKVSVPEMFQEIGTDLEDLGCSVVVERSEDRSVLEDVDVIVMAPGLVYDATLFDVCPALQLIVSPIIGVDTIDVAEAARRGILVANSPVRGNVVGMAEATVMLTVALLLNLKLKENALREDLGRPEHDSSLLADRVVGFVGFGRIAREVEQRLAGWEVATQHYDPYSSESVPLDELLRTSDVVSVNVVLNDETRGMIGDRELAMMKSSAVLVNTARGGVVDEVALAGAIDSGGIRGAAMDVFDVEPINRDNPLLRCDPNRLILTPHCIGHNSGNRPAIAAMVVDAVTRFGNGEPPEYLIDPSAVESWRARRAAS
jgi:phosphoglycerate dehydrogenase-like enzyme